MRTLCPARFEEGSEIYRWIGEVVLGSNVAVPIGQINFLERVPLIGAADEGTTRLPEVGRIDNVLVIPGSDPLQWCPVEIQAVYFSGPNMQLEFKTILEYKGSGVPFPSRVRRPDYRSSAPKRLMPQLQIKVPDLSRWGKKMAVVVDQDFFNAMGKMETVTDLSNCDVVWFVVRYKEGEGRVRLVRGAHVYTKLQSAVDGLIAGRATAQEKFEEKIRDKLKYRSP